MTDRTRGSATLDKAQRRLAQLESVDEHLDLGFGLTLAAYGQLVDKTREALQAHNVLLSDVAESRKRLGQLETDLADLSERMLRGVGIRYGKNSIEYDKAGGSNRKRSRSRSTLELEPAAAAPVVDLASVAVTNGSTNGNGKHPVLH